MEQGESALTFQLNEGIFESTGSVASVAILSRCLLQLQGLLALLKLCHLLTAKSL